MKKVIGLVVVIAALGAGGWYYYKAGPADTAAAWGAPARAGPTPAQDVAGAAAGAAGAA